MNSSSLPLPATWLGWAEEAPITLELPFFLSPCPQAGFPSPAADYVEEAIDLNALIVQNPPANFFVRVQGESLVGEHILPNDIASVDRSVEPRVGKIVVAVFQGDIYIKKLCRIGGRMALESCPADGGLFGYPTYFLDEDENAEVWGVVNGVIRSAP